MPQKGRSDKETIICISLCIKQFHTHTSKERTFNPVFVIFVGIKDEFTLILSSQAEKTSDSSKKNVHEYL